MSGVANDFWPDDGLTQISQRHESRSQSDAVLTLSWSQAGASACCVVVRAGEAEAAAAEVGGVRSGDEIERNRAGLRVRAIAATGIALVGAELRRADRARTLGRTRAVERIMMTDWEMIAEFQARKTRKKLSPIERESRSIDKFLYLTIKLQGPSQQVVARG